MATHSVILAWRVPLDKGAWWSAVHRVTESDTTEATSHTPAGRGHKPRRAGGFLKPEGGEGDVMGREVGGGFIFGNACKN